MKLRLNRVAASFVGVALACLAVSGCSGNSGSPASSASAAPAKKVLLAVSFGTSYDNNRDLSIGGIEKALTTAYPDYQVRRAFTAQTIIDILAKRGTRIDNVKQAMDRLVSDGVKDVVVQPTTVMAGFEYTDLVAEASPYKDRFNSFAIGSPLLTTDDDFRAVAAAITSHTAQYATDGTAVVFMGHGTDAPSNADYAKVQKMLTDAGHKNYFVGTVEATPTVQDVIAAAKKAGDTKAVLLPLMVVAGDHANNDMAGDDADTWKSQFTKAGFQVQCVLEGLGQNPDIQKLYVAHAKAAMDEVAGAPAAATESAAPAPAISSTPSGPELSAKQIKAGTYPIDATTDSSMFKVVDAQLKVADGGMSVVVTLTGDGFGRLFLGTAGTASKATSGFIAFTTDSQGRHVYTIPVDALNKPMSVAAESGKTANKWYDHTMTFQSSRIPAAAITA